MKSSFPDAWRIQILNRRAWQEDGDGGWVANALRGSGRRSCGNISKKFKRTLNGDKTKNGIRRIEKERNQSNTRQGTYIIKERLNVK